MRADGHRIGVAMGLLVIVVAVISGCDAQSRQPKATSESVQPAVQSKQTVASPAPDEDPMNACSVQSFTNIGLAGVGVDWSRSGSNRILTSKYDANQVKQVYTVNPDGSDEVCLSCQQVPGGPPVDVHKGNAHWHPSGDYFFVQVEMSKHTVRQGMADPGTGRSNDIWAATADGSRWWRLTDYSGNPQSAVLYPVVSPDGASLAWTERFARPNRPFATLAQLFRKKPPADLWGQWRINIASLEIDADGPRLTNIRSSRPGDAFFYETQAWSPDSAKLYFNSNIGRDSVYTINIWAMEVATGKLTAVTNDEGQWEEHVSISPDGRKLLFMSSKCCQWDPTDWTTLRTELYLRDIDGANEVQVTHFNSPGYPESTPVQSAVADVSWSPDGQQAAFRRILLTQDFSEDNRASDLWILTFAGPCGKQVMK